MAKQKINDDKVIVGITHGDYNGIAYEVIMKTLQDQRCLEFFTPIIYGSAKVCSYYRKALNIKDFSFNPLRYPNQLQHNKNNLINIYEKEIRIDYGKSTESAGELAFLALEKATEDLKNGDIDVLVTAPINKENIQSDHFHFPGHTEYLANKFNSEDYLMLMVGKTMRLGVITGHIPLKDVPVVLTKELILKKINILHESLVKDFGISKPKIALLGLNPHAGDGGIIGDEDINIIKPAVDEAFSHNKLVFGPFPSDGFFGSGAFKNFDGILAMYHDQGLLPFKTMEFESGVNYTAGLPIVRTSPDHGTAYEIAGKSIASPDSMREAIFTAISIFNNREKYYELNKNKLKKAEPPRNGRKDVDEDLPPEIEQSSDV